MGFWDAFALGPPPDKKDEEAAEWVARKIVERGLAAPAIFILESIKPFSFLMNQMAVGVQPFIAPFFGSERYEKLPKFLEKRENVELLIQKIEALQSEKIASRQEPKVRRQLPATSPSEKEESTDGGKS